MKVSLTWPKSDSLLSLLWRLERGFDQCGRPRRLLLTLLLLAGLGYGLSVRPQALALQAKLAQTQTFLARLQHTVRAQPLLATAPGAQYGAHLTQILALLQQSGFNALPGAFTRSTVDGTAGATYAFDLTLQGDYPSLYTALQAVQRLPDTRVNRLTIQRASLLSPQVQAQVRIHFRVAS